MDYSIRELSELAGVSARTLRYYDEIGLLKPAYVSGAGYRYYREQEAARLQQILFYRARGFGLKQIHRILSQESFDLMAALEEHLLELEAQRKRMDVLICTVQKTIASMKGEYQMSDKEKFEGFKEGLIEENEAKYGQEIRGRYGEDVIDASNKKLMGMSETEYAHFKELESEIRNRLKAAVRAGIQASDEESRQIFALHREWIQMTWPVYSAEAHKGLVQMYLADERFRAYYDQELPGCAQLLAELIGYWAEKI